MEMDARKPNILILLAGLGTSFLCLLIVFLLNKVDFNLMGLYILFIIPAGGLLVGTGSGSGYALASWLFNIRVKKIYFIFIAIIALATYIASHYVTYLNLLQQEGLTQADVNFFNYLQFWAENITYSLRTGDEGIAMGKFGYLFLALEAIGFSVGTFLPLFFLSKAAYCPACRLYMKKALLVNLPAAFTTADLKKKSSKERKELLAQAIAEARAKYTALVPDLEKMSIEEVKNLLAPYAANKTAGVLAYAQIVLYACPNGDTASIRPTLNNLGPDNKLQSQKLAEIVKGASFATEPNPAG